MLRTLTLALAASISFAAVAATPAAPAAAPTKSQIDAFTLHKFLGLQERFPSVAVFAPSGCFVGYYLPDDYGRIATTCAPGGKNIKQLGASTPRLDAKKPTAFLLVMPERFHCAPCAPELANPQLDKALGGRKSQFAVVRTEVVVNAKLGLN